VARQDAELVASDPERYTPAAMKCEQRDLALVLQIARTSEQGRMDEVKPLVVLLLQSYGDANLAKTLATTVERCAEGEPDRDLTEGLVRALAWGRLEVLE